MKTNDRYRNTWLLCLLLTVAFWALSGCQTQSAQQPTSTMLPKPPTVTIAQPTPEPTFTTLPEPPTVTIAQPTRGPTSTALPEPPRVSVEQVRQWMEQGEPLTILDSRSAGDWAVAKTKVPGSLRVPPDDVEPHLSQIPRDRRIIIYCA